MSLGHSGSGSSDSLRHTLLDSSARTIDGDSSAHAAVGITPDAPDDAADSTPRAPYDFDAPFVGDDERELRPQRVHMPVLSDSQLAQMEKQAPHHLFQTQSLLLVLLLSSMLTLLLLYATMRVVSLMHRADNLFLGADTSLASRAKYFGLPALASMVLNMLCYAGFRAVWKKKSWRAMRELDGIGAMLHDIQRTLMGPCRYFRKRASNQETLQRQQQEEEQRQQQHQQQQRQHSGSTASMPIYGARNDAIDVPSQATLAASVNWKHSVTSNFSPAPTSLAFSDYARVMPAAAFPPPDWNTVAPAASRTSIESEMSPTRLNQLQRQYLAGLGNHTVTPIRAEATAAAQDDPSAVRSPLLTSPDDSAAAADENSFKLRSVHAAATASGANVGTVDSSRHMYAPPDLSNATPEPLSLHESSASTFFHAFDPPPSTHPYFFHASVLLHPSDVALLKQHPGWTHHLWAIGYQYYLFLLIPMSFSMIAMCIFSAEKVFASWELSAFLSGSTFLVTQLVKGAASLPDLCFGSAARRSSWGAQFQLNLYVALLAILLPLYTLISHAVAIIISGVTDPSAANERKTLEALFDSVWLSYLTCVLADELTLTAQAIYRYKQMQRERDAPSTPAPTPSDASADQAKPPTFRESLRASVQSSLMSYSLEGELKLFLYAIIYPLCTSTMCPSILLVACGAIPFIWIGCKVRYSLFAHLLNEPEEVEQIRGNKFRRGSDLLSFGSMLSVLYTTTQWVVSGGAIVLVLLNFDQLVNVAHSNGDATSSSTGAGFTAHVWRNSNMSASEWIARAPDIAEGSMRRLLEISSSVAAATVSSDVAAAPWTSLPSSFSSLSYDEALSSTGGSGGSTGDPAQASFWSSPVALWSMLLLVLWVARSLYFLCGHQVKAARTTPWGLADTQLLPRHMRGTALLAPKKVGPLEEYILSELNPDKISALAVSLSRRHSKWLFPWWVILHATLLGIVLSILALLVGFLVALYSLCSELMCSTRQLAEEGPYANCASVCLNEVSVLEITVWALFFLPLPLILFAVLTAWIYQRPMLWINSFFLGLASPAEYKGKFFQNPCWTCSKRSRLYQAQNRRLKLRRAELVAALGKEEGNAQAWREEEALKRPEEATPNGFVQAASVVHYVAPHTPLQSGLM